MKANLGKSDQAIRIVAGLVLVVFGLLAQDPWRWVGLLGPVFVVTAFVRFCPIYRILGLSTCGSETCGTSAHPG